jgi:hypothetical protein
VGISPKKSAIDLFMASLVLSSKPIINLKRNSFNFKRELARQTMLTIKYYADAAVNEGFPELRILACIGGDPIKNQG